MNVFIIEADDETSKCVEDFCDKHDYPEIVFWGLVSFVLHERACGSDITPESLSKCLKSTYGITADEDDLTGLALLLNL